MLTLKNANKFEFRNITDLDITKRIVDLDIGRIKNVVQRQRHKQFPSEFSGNKIVVLHQLKPGDIEKIPPFFEFEDEEFGRLRMPINYFGKPYFCTACNEYHKTTCPKEAETRALEEERDKAKSNGKLPIKTYGDSTLRQVSQNALASEVDAMPGATLGNSLNAQEIDADGDAPNLIFVAGRNVLNKQIPIQEMMWSEKKSVERLATLAENKKIAILQPPKQDFMAPEDKAKEEVFRSILQEAAANTNIVMLEHPCQPGDSAIDDFTWHPDEIETKDMLMVVSECANNHFDTLLLLPSATDDNIVTNRGYARVNALYKYGCGGCNRKDRNKWFHLCDYFKKSMESDEWIKEMVRKYEDRVEEIREQELPPLDDRMDDSTDGDLECPVCKLHFNNTGTFNQHFKQTHPDEQKAEEKSQQIRGKGKYGNNTTH